MNKGICVDRRTLTTDKENGGADTTSVKIAENLSLLLCKAMADHHGIS